MNRTNRILWGLSILSTLGCTNAMATNEPDYPPVLPPNLPPVFYNHDSKPISIDKKNPVPNTRPKAPLKTDLYFCYDRSASQCVFALLDESATVEVCVTNCETGFSVSQEITATSYTIDVNLTPGEYIITGMSDQGFIYEGSGYIR